MFTLLYFATVNQITITKYVKILRSESVGQLFYVTVQNLSKD